MNPLKNYIQESIFKSRVTSKTVKSEDLSTQLLAVDTQDWKFEEVKVDVKGDVLVLSGTVSVRGRQQSDSLIILSPKTLNVLNKYAKENNIKKITMGRGVQGLHLTLTNEYKESCDTLENLIFEIAAPNSNLKISLNGDAGQRSNIKIQNVQFIAPGTVTFSNNTSSDISSIKNTKFLGKSVIVDYDNANLPGIPKDLLDAAMKDTEQVIIQLPARAKIGNDLKTKPLPKTFENSSLETTIGTKIPSNIQGLTIYYRYRRSDKHAILVRDGKNWKSRY